MLMRKILISYLSFVFTGFLLGSIAYAVPCSSSDTYADPSLMEQLLKQGNGEMSGLTAGKD